MNSCSLKLPTAKRRISWQSTQAILAKEQENSAAIIKKQAELTDKDREIEHLKARLERADTEKELAISEAVRQKEKEISDKSTKIMELTGQLNSQEKENQLKEKSLKEQYEDKLKYKDEQIEYYKDFKGTPVHQNGGGKPGTTLPYGV